jgi:hypothetical protein
MNPFEEITVDDMPTDDLKWIAEDCGLPMASALLFHFGKGISIYIPSFKPIDWKKIIIDTLPNDDMKLVAEKCGIQIVRKLIENFPQSVIYFPRLETTKWAINYIQKHYNGSNAKRLAAALGVSDRFIYKCMQSQIRKPQKGPDGFVYIDGHRQEKMALELLF